jgi:hypothetical protein
VKSSRGLEACNLVTATIAAATAQIRFLIPLLGFTKFNTDIREKITSSKCSGRHAPLYIK